MSMERLSQQVDAYVAWKRELMREITRYRSWLAHNRLGSDAMDARLERALKLLRTDHITLAFVGEFSRGKTELINSLFFSEYGQRMLPSHAGRTTMCPTELFFDPRSERSYIRLLPIETRMTDASVAQFKRIPRHWVNIPLDPSDPDNMALAFAQVAKTKPMPVEQAIQLGFLPDMLEPAGKPGQVLVPAWRHAMVNFDHPLLRQGLRILDTPGLNALGSEPELTLSMLPSAQAILFLLAADTGVTASDMAIWNEHIRQLDDDTQASLFAVLNKIDVLWDDLAGEEYVQKAIGLVRNSTAKQLGIPAASVLPLSAKQALIAKVRKDEELLARSQLADLEQLLCERIVAQKERLLEERVVNQVLALLNNSQHVLNLRLEKVREQQTLLSHHQHDNGQLLFELTAKTKEDHALHHKRLLGLKTNQRLLKRQGDLLRIAVRPERLEEHLTQVRQGLSGSWTTLGINQAIVQFFRNVEHDLGNLTQEAEMANKMVAAIYRRHNEENPLHGVDAPQFNSQRYQRELKQLRNKADQFRLQLKTLLTEQRSLTKRFFATLVQEVMGLHQRLRAEAEQWAGDALMPLMQHTLEHKQMLETHMLRLKALAQETQQARQRDQQLAGYLATLETQLAQAGEMLRVLRRPAPIQRQGKVVNLPTAARSQGGADSA
ncbi:dynamin-like GTPase family protein [Aquipseudomonas alcaligenes]|uniref:Replication fork clamp-binding protein CrfC (Dynamin-like GTPase family) n=1 Tax=Aquipseudomonas alcaligenes TaxID=43263 RepID=A0A1N6UID1_AQUAC|nr:dynamin-like GTPase family protein [Pseudomonas alcaligenes]SIQ65343.1 Replication fork clamp-binding protein CrfC (dynamin-like GTPase family) [Pseudomonas alcaligenes]